MRPPGLLLAFDGIDSSGKATQTKLLAERLRFSGHYAINLATPDYTTTTGQRLKKLLQNKDSSWHQIPWDARMRLFADNRVEHRAEVLATLKDGDIVVYDRYIPSSLAFFTVEGTTPQTVDLDRAKIQREIEHLEYLQNKMPRASVSIFLDVPPRVSASLLDHRKQAVGDDAEYTDHVHVQERLYNEYDLFCATKPEHFIRIKCVQGDELLGKASVGELVWGAILMKFPQLHHRL